MQLAPIPSRFGEAAGAVLDRREQRKLDQAAGLVPFAVKLHQDLVSRLHALAAQQGVGLNEVAARLISAGLAAEPAVSGAAAKAPATVAPAKTAAKTVADAVVKTAAKKAAVEKPAAKKAVGAKAAPKPATKTPTKPAAKKAVNKPAKPSKD